MPILIEFTGGNGALGPETYTKLSPSSMEAVIGRWDSSRALPCLIGTGYINAETREDCITGTGTVNTLYLGLALGLTLLVGIIADICIPRLPGGTPLRDFGVLSSITISRPALHKLDTETNGDSGVGSERVMRLGDLRREIGDVPTYTH
ncbi:hypothetical protein BOTBODRAFT_177404 [Botryobasidium botryosum FD-172 SS1]|uniref:Uncharacterized protein n=1 Tax=Botryobasidium botryosum (strain FD-172 SS1) TaxID=930990 RepID=A0A067MIJ6_BOTB1|nr:hypothetical protein BOTBODRAFT_177404 [Botryobasidium botryosum FD-172 SS1]